jgi:TetR/AcrR family transcriptional regulator, transcriptional repressor for nem operon
MNDSREHILTVSLQLFLQKNFKEVTMKEIVDQTGLSKGAFYHYFSSKEQVFKEVIIHFFTDLLTEDFEQYSHNSLEEFIRDALKSMDSKLKSARILFQSKDHSFSANHYYLLFDAIKMFPDFKAQLFEKQKEEQKAWARIAAIARKNKEIRTDLTDDQVGKLFIYLGDGLGISLMMLEEMNKLKKELQVLWEGLYNSLKK